MIYFDNSATTRVDSDIAQVAAEAMTKKFRKPFLPSLCRCSGISGIECRPKPDC